MLHIALSMMVRLLRLVPKGTSVLELGPATGYQTLLSALQATPYELVLVNDCSPEPELEN